MCQPSKPDDQSKPCTNQLRVPFGTSKRFTNVNLCQQVATAQCGQTGRMKQLMLRTHNASFKRF